MATATAKPVLRAPAAGSAAKPAAAGEDRSRSSTSRCGWRKASSTSSTASSSSATRRRATTSSAARSRLFEGGVFNTEALKYSVKRINQLGYFKPLEGEAVDVQKTADAEKQSRRPAEVRRAEPQPDHVRRRRVAVRGLLRAARVPDVELPRPRRDLQRVGAAGQPRQELPGRLHRAVPLRPADHRGRRRLQPGDPVHRRSSRRRRPA